MTNQPDRTAQPQQDKVTSPEQKPNQAPGQTPGQEQKPGQQPQK